MLNKDLISVIIPAYNHEMYIGETIRSLIIQSYENVELIILNDGSRDNTNQVIRDIRLECEKRFVDFKYINKDNEGIIKTLNKGLSLAGGKFIYIIASDDSAEPDALKIILLMIMEKDAFGIKNWKMYTKNLMQNF
jgi:alpha-1,3-rhamnosyltransferase